VDDPRGRWRAVHRRRGFTLIEVLGAVAVLGITYMMLATASISGLRMIGESSRRSDASLLADRLLSEIELKAEIGQLIEIGYEESAEEPFTVVVEILDLAEEYGSGGGGTSNDADDLLGFLSAEANGPFAEYRDSNWLLGYLREVHISVQWQEGAKEITVSRTSYIYDQQAWIEFEQGKDDAEQAGRSFGDNDVSRRF